MSVSAVRVSLQPAHGYIPFVVIGAGLVGTWAGIKVGVARKQYNIPYPQMYAEKKEKNAKEFNCVQRAHQNVLEHLPLFYAMLATSSIYRPTIAAAAGVVRLAGFVMYVKGYSSGDPGKRRKGNFGYLGMLVMLGLSLEAALRLLGYL
ncbi:Microsomal Glutathione S-transferase [Phytophthora megakarya]|uniref:Microsomal Glutathione S-transferase n=1 Tax=Phytophthora megakarya TaxID=4795 RepID=A0A225WXS0_9STRA|nr:Microsomal Glutathione S-transferase [Phytophthora megakarya]